MFIPIMKPRIEPKKENVVYCCSLRKENEKIQAVDRFKAFAKSKREERSKIPKDKKKLKNATKEFKKRKQELFPFCFPLLASTFRPVRPSQTDQSVWSWFYFLRKGKVNS